MYDSAITAEDFVASVASTVNIGCSLPEEFYLDVLSRLEQLLYSEHIREERLLFADAIDGEIDLSQAIVPEGERIPRADDIFAVYFGDRPLRRIRLSEAYLLEPEPGQESFYKSDDAKISLCLSEEAEEDDIAVFYHAAPRLKVGEGKSDRVALPFEFLSLAEAKLRGEAYKLADDDASAAKWLSEYNTLLSSFATWAKGRGAV